MHSKTKYKNPPITEALIDIQVDPPLAVSSAEIANLHKNLLNKYPVKKERRTWETQIQIKEGVPVETGPKDRGVDGYQFWSSDNKQICQYRLSGFTLSRLKPYEEWEKFLPEALDLWKTYQTKLLPTNISRIAVRFLNLIEIPEERIELEEYFINPPRLAESFPGDLDGFLQRLNIRLGDNINAIKTLALQEGGSTKTTVLLDIDVFSKINIKLVSLDNEKLEKLLNKLHEHLLEIFQNSLTQKTKDLFE